jgi:hypothetical protein
MEKETGYLTLAQVVKSFMNERNERTLANYERYLQMAIEGFSDINLFELNTIEVAYLKMNSAKVVQLPPDYIKYTKIGINLGGRVWTLTLNNDLVLPKEEDICADPIEEVNSGDSEYVPNGYWVFAPHFRRGEWTEGLYGLGGGFNRAYYRIDTQNRTIQFEGVVPNSEIILEYKSTGIKCGGAIVPRQASKALKAYIRWMVTENDPTVGLGEKIRKEQLYDKELFSLKFLENSFTMDEYLDSMYEVYKQTPKR